MVLGSQHEIAKPIRPGMVFLAMLLLIGVETRTSHCREITLLQVLADIPSILFSVRGHVTFLLHVFRTLFLGSLVPFPRSRYFTSR